MHKQMFIGRAHGGSRDGEMMQFDAPKVCLAKDCDIFGLPPTTSTGPMMEVKIETEVYVFSQRWRGGTQLFHGRWTESSVYERQMMDRIRQYANR